MIILGIDPGTTRIGYGIIKKDRALTCIESGLLGIHGDSLEEKLRSAHRALSGIITKFSPELAALETIYFGKNKKTAIDVAHARGVMVLALSQQGIPLTEYTPQQVKQAVTGHGGSDKKAMVQVLSRLLRIDFGNEPDDVSDAVAVALTASLDNLVLRRNSLRQRG